MKNVVEGLTFWGESVNGQIRFQAEDDDVLILAIKKEALIESESDDKRLVFSVPATDGELITEVIKGLNSRYVQLYNDVINGAHSDEPI